MKKKDQNGEKSGMGNSYIQTDEGSVMEVKIIPEALNDHKVPSLNIERLTNLDDNNEHIYE